MFNNKINYDGNTVSFEVITPEIAEMIIEDSSAKFSSMDGFHQRRVRMNTVNMYAKDMEQGRWKFNGDTIRFDKEGRLMDGQHRMKAIIKSGIPQICLVVRGIDNSVMDTIDNGLKRSLENALQFQAESYENRTAEVVKAKMQLDNMNKCLGQSNANAKLSQTEMVDEYMFNQEMYKKAVHYAKEVNKSVKTLRVSEVGAIYLHLTETKGFDRDIVKDFFFNLCNVRFNEKSIYKITLDKLSKIKQGQERINEYMKCWNAMVKGNKKRPEIDENTWFLTPKEVA